GQGTVFATSGDGTLYAASARDGNLEWTFRTGGPILSAPVLDGAGRVYVTSQDARLYALFTAGTVDWVWIADGPLSSTPTITTDGTIYFGSDSGKLYGLR